MLLLVLVLVMVLLATPYNHNPNLSNQCIQYHHVYPSLLAACPLLLADFPIGSTWPQTCSFLLPACSLLLSRSQLVTKTCYSSATLLLAPCSFLLAACCLLLAAGCSPFPSLSFACTFLSFDSPCFCLNVSRVFPPGSGTTGRRSVF